MGLSTVGSGLDIQTVVANLVAAERRPVENRINNAGVAATTKVSALGTVKNSLSALQSALEGLTKAASRSAFKATQAENSGFTSTIATDAATGKTLASAGTHSVEVVSLAQSQKLSSTAFGKDVQLGSGTLSIAYGDKTLTVDIGEDSTLSDIAAAINKVSGGKGVTAGVVTADDGQHLVLSAVDAGTKGALKISASGAAGALQQLTWDGSSGGLSQTVPATDAVVKVDGFTRTSSSNTVADLIPGVTLNLVKAEPGTPKTLTVSQDTTGLKTNLQAFIAAYNATSSMLRSASAYDAATGTSAVLTGDSGVRSVQQQLRATLSANVAELTDLGVIVGKDGSLALEVSTFDKALAADPVGAEKLFGEQGAVSAGLKDLLKGQVDATTGTLTQRQSALNKQIKTLERELDDLDVRMERVSKRYLAQFTAMDQMVAQMQSTSSYLTQQMASLNAKTSK